MRDAHTGRLRELDLADRRAKCALVVIQHEQRVAERALREPARLDAMCVFKCTGLVGEGDRELELAADPRAVRVDSREHRGERVPERTVRPTSGVRPREQLIAHGPHRELALPTR